MERTHCIVALGVITLFVGMAGCGDGDATGPVASISGDQQTAVAQPPRADTPTNAVGSFLEAVRKGNRDIARGMLTPLAIQKTEENNLNFSPPGSDTARYQVGSAEITAPGLARVATVWTDLDENGDPRPEQIMWIVKQSGNEWRISGMIAQLGPEERVEIDFEQPDELVRRQELTGGSVPAEDRADRQASRPEDPFQRPGPQ